jgi:hypothetical protein
MNAWQASSGPTGAGRVARPLFGRNRRGPKDRVLSPSLIQCTSDGYHLELTQSLV